MTEAASGRAGGDAAEGGGGGGNSFALKTLVTQVGVLLAFVVHGARMRRLPLPLLAASLAVPVPHVLSSFTVSPVKQIEVGDGIGVGCLDIPMHSKHTFLPSFLSPCCEKSRPLTDSPRRSPLSYSTYTLLPPFP